MDKLSRKTNFTEIQYDLKAQIAIKLRGIVLENGLEPNLLFWPISKLNKINPNPIF